MEEFSSFICISKCYCLYILCSTILFLVLYQFALTAGLRFIYIYIYIHTHTHTHTHA